MFVCFKREGMKRKQAITITDASYNKSSVLMIVSIATQLPLNKIVF